MEENKKVLIDFDDLIGPMMHRGFLSADVVISAIADAIKNKTPLAAFALSRHISEQFA